MEYSIPETELVFTYVRSSGAGGQNVNKVNSKAVLHWNVVGSESLPILVKARFVEKWKNHISSEGNLVLTSDRYRDQERNKQDVADKVYAMIEAVWVPPKIRRKTKPTRSSVEKRVKKKKENTEKKKGRKPISWE